MCTAVSVCRKGGGEGGQQRGKLACANSEASRRGRRVARKNIDDELRRVIFILQIAFFFFFLNRKGKLSEIKALENSYACSQPTDQSRRLMDAIKGLYGGFDSPFISSRGSSIPDMLLDLFDYAKTYIPLIGHW